MDIYLQFFFHFFYEDDIDQLVRIVHLTYESMMMSVSTSSSMAYYYSKVLLLLPNRLVLRVHIQPMDDDFQANTWHV